MAPRPRPKCVRGPLCDSRDRAARFGRGFGQLDGEQGHQSAITIAVLKEPFSFQWLLDVIREPISSRRAWP